MDEIKKNQEQSDEELEQVTGGFWIPGFSIPQVPGVTVSPGSSDAVTFSVDGDTCSRDGSGFGLTDLRQECGKKQK